MRYRFVARHRDEERDVHDTRIIKFMRPNGVQFDPRTRGPLRHRGDKVFQVK
jgi:hypothetical protein